MLSLLKARKIIDQAIRRAKELDVSISVAVCDNTGRLIALNRMDGCLGWEVDRSSIGKAVAAAVTGLPSDRLHQYMQTNGSLEHSFNHVVTPLARRGGLPVIEEGVVQGGCGVSGAARAEHDEECARAGIAMIGKTVTESPVVADADRVSASPSMADSP
jgi:uncharacterized protein GlcG (DUF336 family)